MKDIEPFLTKDTRNAIVTHALEDLSVEVCGLIKLSTGGEYEYERVGNLHPEPGQHFRLSKSDAARLRTKKNVVAYVHSHPNGPVWPSENDVAVQLRIGKPSVIVARDIDSGAVEVFSFGDHLLDAPLIEREFRFNVYDCLAALRSWVWQHKGRHMPGKAYAPGWWDIGKEDPSQLADNPNLYEKCFEEYGYQLFDPDFTNPESPNHPKIGDVLLMQMGAPVVNHVAVYEGNNLIYHHRVNKKSGLTPIGYLMGTNVIRKWVRHEADF